MLLAFLTLGAPITVWADEPRTQGIGPYYGFVHWVSMGELDRAARQFAPDARVVAGPACTVVAPCVGREAIERHYLSRLRDGALPLPITDQRFDGRAMTTRGDTLEHRTAGEATQRLRTHHRIEHQLHVALHLGGSTPRHDRQHALWFG